MPFRYINSNLLSDETIKYMVRPHWIVFIPAALLLVLSCLALSYLPSLLNVLDSMILLGMPLYKLISLVIFLAALLQGARAYIMHQTSEYGITNKRILMKTGWIRRRSIEVFLDKVEAIYVNQTVPGRLFNYGTIIIVGTGGSQDPFLYIPAPLKFRHLTQEQIDQEDTARREH